MADSRSTSSSGGARNATADGVKTELAKMVLDARLVDGVFHRLTADVKGNKVGISVDGVRILEQAVDGFPGGRFGLYVEKEWWPQVESYAVADADGQAVFRRRLGDREPAHGGAWSGMPVACGFATPEEALEILRRVPLTGGSKAHLGNIRGAFAYGFDEKAFAMLENGTWLKLADPSWEDAQCCTECGFLTRSGWWDESHPDTAVSGDMTAYLLGVRPVEPGFATFRFEPHVVSRLTFAEGSVPTPHGDIAARWERTGDAVAATLTVPAGTTATFGCRLSKDVTVDGAPYAGGALGPGRHAIAVRGVTAESFADAALWGGAPADGEDWRVLPGMDGVADANPEAAFEMVADLGATYELRAAELTAGPDNLFPSEIRIEASADGKTFTCLAHQTRVRSPGTRRTLELDLCTVGSDPVGRYVKFIFRRPPVSRNDMGEPWYNVVLPKIRVRVGR